MKTQDPARILAHIQRIDQSILDLSVERDTAVRDLTTLLTKPLPVSGVPTPRPVQPPAKYLAITKPHLFGGLDPTSPKRVRRRHHLQQHVRKGSPWGKHLRCVVADAMDLGRDMKISEIVKNVRILYPQATRDKTDDSLTTSLSSACRLYPDFFLYTPSKNRKKDSATFKLLRHPEPPHTK